MNVIGERVENLSFDFGVADPTGGGECFRDGAQLVDCRIRFVSPGHTMIFCSTLTGCALHMQKRANGLHLSSAFFRGCTFTGRYYDTRFGTTSDLTDICRRPGGLVDCDFSRASLHLCTFFNCDPATLKLPSWPHFTVLHPRRNAADWLAVPFPDPFYGYHRTVSTSDPECVAFTIHWPTYAKKHKDPTDPEAIRQLLSGRDYIRL